VVAPRFPSACTGSCRCLRAILLSPPTCPSGPPHSPLQSAESGTPCPDTCCFAQSALHTLYGATRVRLSNAAWYPALIAHTGPTSVQLPGALRTTPTFNLQAARKPGSALDEHISMLSTEIAPLKETNSDLREETKQEGLICLPIGYQPPNFAGIFTILMPFFKFFRSKTPLQYADKQALTNKYFVSSFGEMRVPWPTVST
jgi:hypothetical protein